MPNPGGGGSAPTGSGGDAGTSVGGNGATDGGNVGGTAGTPSSDAGAGGDIGVVIPVTRCTGPADCVPQAPVCDTDLDRCVVCMLEDDSGCDSATPYCVGAGNDTAKCVECESETDCDGSTPLCSPNGACVACMQESDCAVFPSTPLCRPDGECVACLSENDCSAAMPVCDETGECSGCDDSAQCAHLPDTAECDTATGACVECVGNAECTEPTAPRCAANECTGCQGAGDCADMGDLAVCGTASGACVECVLDADCGSTTAAACVNNACVPCTTDAQCAHLSDVCDVGAGECVECTGVKDDLCVVGGDEYVCDSLNRQCAAAVPSNEVGSADVCDACLSDAHCAEGQLCVMTGLDEQDAGYFCQWVQAAGSCSPVEPFYGDAELPSIDSAVPVTMCVLRETTCFGLFQYLGTNPSCEVNEDCGAVGFDDGRCTPSNECSIPCRNGSDCPNDAPCSLAGYCEL